MPELNNNSTVPKHIGIIMDGNGRWATKQNLPRTMGHKKGLDIAREIMVAAADAGVEYLTLYTFSTENWTRTQEEVGFLMNLLRVHLKNERNFYMKQGIRLLHLGDITGLSEDIQIDIKKVIDDSKNNARLNLVLAINYGGRDEIIRAVNKIESTSQQTGVYPTITSNNFTDYFDLPEIPDVDMIIRTGGEKRLSNFLLWHASYAEFYFSDTLWPDYTKNEFLSTISDFQKRNRRFGGNK